MMKTNAKIIPLRVERRAHPEEWGANADLDGDNIGTESDLRPPFRLTAIALSGFVLIGLTVIATVFLINLAIDALRGG